MSNFYLKATTTDAVVGKVPSTSGLLFKIFAKGLGDMPNLQMKTLGGHHCWDTLMESGGMRLQKNKFSKHARILNKNNERIAWGSYDAMKAKMKRLRSEDFLEPGDVIGIKRRAGYEHYAIYAGNDEVIHFAADDGDFGSPYIHKAPMDDFLNGQDKFFVLDFSSGSKAYKLFSDTDMHSLKDPVKIKSGCIYSPQETLERAESVIGANEHDFKEKYNLLLNNCEHFAIWCKTGRAKSYQVEEILKNLSGTYYIASGLIDGI